MGAGVKAATVEARRSERKARGDGHLRRGEILAAAEAIFVAEGYEGATIRRIAEEVGVSSTSLYMHFPDKGAILLEICKVTLQHLLESNRAVAALPLDPVTRVRRMLEAYIRFGLENPNAYRLVFIEERDNAEDLGRQCYEVFSQTVGQIAAEGRLRATCPEAATQALWAACHGLISLLVTRPGWAGEPPETLMQVLLDGLFFGLTVD
jgi:AcrR family transcriptional regulator